MFWFLGISLSLAQDTVSAVYSTLTKQPVVDSELLEQAAIEGMLKVFDAQNSLTGSVLLNQEAYERDRLWREGWREGYGLRVQLIPGRGFHVEGVMEDSPASQAGIHAGDLLVGLNHRSLIGLNSQTMLAIMSQEVQGSIPVEVLRGGQSFEFSLDKGSFQMQMLSVGEAISIHFFGSGVAEQLNTLFVSHPNLPKVIDLRDNEGGLWEESFAALDIFIEADQVLGYRQSTDGTAIPILSTHPATITEPIVLLVNQGTQGPAELFALVLQEKYKATIIGERTFGDAVDYRIQYPKKDWVLMLADTEILSSKKQSWNQVGITPNMVIPRGLVEISTYTGVQHVDRQLQTAMQLIATSP